MPLIPFVCDENKVAAELLPSRNQPARGEHKIRFKTDSISHMLINEFSMNIICIIFVECK